MVVVCGTNRDSARDTGPVLGLCRLFLICLLAAFSPVDGQKLAMQVAHVQLQSNSSVILDVMP